MAQQSSNGNRPKLSEKGLLTPGNCVVALIDHQGQMLFGTSNFGRQGIINNTVVMQWPGPISERYSSRLSSGSAALTFTRLFHSSRQFSNCVPPRRSDPTKESAFVQDAQSNLIDS